MNTENNTSTWEKDVKKALIERDMTVSQLAAEIGFSRTYVSCVINGIYNSNSSHSVKQKICEYLGIAAA